MNLNIFLPKAKGFKEIPYREKQKINNIIVGALVCIPIFLVYSFLLFFLYGYDSAGRLTLLSPLFLLVSLLLVKIGKSRTASYCVTLGFILMAFVVAFFMPVSRQNEFSTFVNYRTCGFVVVLAVVNSFFAFRKFQLTQLHIASLVALFASSFTVYLKAYENSPSQFLGSVIISAAGIFGANMILIFAWNFNERVLKHSEKTRDEIEDLNKNLESKIEERTKDLSAANEKLSASEKHSQRDMNLAVNVQRAFYPHQEIEVDGWEVSFFFQPASGVAGDLYDFYTTGKEFKGCCLFDVSGHGISSGLVAMLAKTLINQEFDRGQNLPLSKVMQNINNAIAQNKGEVENYLTGILLRINGDRIEYVNGAHPALLWRSGTSGRVSQVISPKKSADGGSVVGIRDLPASFTGVNFAMRPGDSVMLYTDCLYESRNELGEEFGAENVARIFGQSNDGTAQDQISSLIRQFKEYTGTVPLADDLTVIIVKRV